MIDMFLYCMEEGRELSDWSTGDLTVHGHVAAYVLYTYVDSVS
jgi:hypothetical protein